MTERLAAIAELIGDAQWVIDIGCEHGQLAPYLPDRRLIGVDRLPHVLDAAPAGMVGLAADCLHALSPVPGAALVFAGIGERSMIAWLDEHAAHMAVAQCLVLCPSAVPYRLRPALNERGWYCAREVLVNHAGRWQVVIRAERGEEPEPDPDRRLLGPRMHAASPAQLVAYCEHQVATHGRVAQAPEPDPVVARWLAAAVRIVNEKR